MRRKYMSNATLRFVICTKTFRYRIIRLRYERRRAHRPGTTGWAAERIPGGRGTRPEEDTNMVALIRSDLEFILEQILIAERPAAGEPLASLVSDPSQPQGLRTVDGTYNNLIQGRENWGAAGNAFPRSLTPTFDAAEPSPFTGQPTSYAQKSGSVFDSQPRTIST